MVDKNRAAKARELVRSSLPAACREHGRSWIGGEWVSSTRSEHFETVDPTTGESLLQLDVAGADEVGMAVAAGAEAQNAWWNKDGQDRAATLWRFAAGIRAKRDALAILDTLDAGRPIRDTTNRDVERAARILEFFAGVTDRLRGATVPVQPGLLNRTVLEPYGVTAGIIPWNYPLTNAVTKIAPALATGNAIVLKPAEETPLSALLLAEIGAEAGVPAGLLNIVNGPGDVTGEALVVAPNVEKIAFTGSTEVGRRIAAVAGQSLKSVTLELGGKSPCVVFEDANIDAAAAAIVFSILSNQGQTCTSATRIIVSRPVVGQLRDAILSAARSVRVGDPLDPDTLVGPLVSRKQIARVGRYIEMGAEEGAKLHPISVDWQTDGLDGFFLRPVLFDSVSPSMRISQEEIFGPVLTMVPFDTEEEALALANDTQFGLAGSIWTEGLKRAERLSAQLAVGIVWVNTVHSLHPGSPYGGYRSSGLGVEMGLEAVNQLMKTKSIWTATDTWRSPWDLAQ